jgi:hypothetical protein
MVDGGRGGADRCQSDEGQRPDVDRMMEPELFRAARYRQEAARVRGIALTIHDAFVRRQMFSVADQYDGLAEFVENAALPE